MILQSRLQATAPQAKALEGKLNEHVPGEVLVKLKGGDHLQDSLASDYGLDTVETIDLPAQRGADNGEILRMKLPEGVSDEQGIAMLRQDPRVAYAETNDILQQFATPNDLDPKLWGMAKIEAEQAWEHGTGSKTGPLIAVIDTGADLNHPDLKNNLWTNPGEIAGDGIDNDNNGVVDDVHGYNAMKNSGDPSDDVGHGTHCFGTVAAEGNNGQGVVGVNWNAQIMPVKFLGRNGGTLADAVKGISYATKMGARVTSNSWGGGGYNEALKDALASSPALHIFAAGNDSNDNDKKATYPASYDLPNLVAVAATTSTDGMASFSNYGKTSVDLGAPGKDIYSTYPGGGYKSLSGTSMACPHVAGAAGLLLAMEPSLSNDQVKDLLFSTTDPVPALADKTVTGGRLNLNKAVQKLKDNSPTDPPAPPEPGEPGPGQPPGDGDGKGCFKLFS